MPVRFNRLRALKYTLIVKRLKFLTQDKTLGLAASQVCPILPLSGRSATAFPHLSSFKNVLRMPQSNNLPVTVGRFAPEAGLVFRASGGL